MFLFALKALARHHVHLTDDQIEKKAVALLEKYLERDSPGTILSLLLAVFAEQEPKEISGEELVALTLVLLWCDVLVLEGKFRETAAGAFEIVPHV